MFVVMNARRFLLCGTLLLLLPANGVYADGTYQRTKDGKTFVWNPDPNPEDAATWSGKRDKEDYATGYGTLTWYRVERKYGMGSRYSVEKDIPVIRYSGNMVRGKLEGLVVADAEGKISHAMFASGNRTEEWAAGPAASANSPKNESVSERHVAEQPSADLSLQQLPSNDQHSPLTRRPDQPATEPLSPRTTMALQVEPFSPEPTPIPERRANHRVVQQPVIEAPAEGPSAEASPAPSPVPEQRASNDSPVANRAATPTAGRPTDLLQSLALPPESSALTRILVAATLPGREAPITSTSSSPEASSQASMPPPASSPPAAPRLTTAEVIGLADEEARTQGYDLAGYQCSKVDYIVTENTWSVWYDQKPVEGMAEPGKHFSVTVEDKTRKTFIAPQK
jgi:hypothetical protein